MTLAGCSVLFHHSIPAVQNTVKKIALHLSPLVGFMALLRSPTKLPAIMGRAAAAYREPDHAGARFGDLPEPLPGTLSRLLGLDLTVARRGVGLQRLQQPAGAIGHFGDR